MVYTKFDGLHISMLGMGNMRLPVDSTGNIDQEKAQQIIDYGYSNGINYFDTAYRYHGGESELFIGNALKKYPRNTWFLASKMPGHMMTYENGKLGFVGYLANENIQSVSQIFEDQLKRCDVDHFDFYLLHNVCETSYDVYTNSELNIVGYLLEQKTLGRIKHLGFSTHARPETIERFIKQYPNIFEFAQIQVNYLDWKLQDAQQKYDILTKHNIPIIAMEPVRGGKLANLSEHGKAILKNINTQATYVSWAFRFLQSLPNIKITLSGMTTIDQITENIQIYSQLDTLSQIELDQLDKVVNTMVDMLPCTECGYCKEECPKNLDIPKLHSFYNEAKFGGLGLLSFNIGNMSESQLPKACINCGACSKVCPQEIQVPKMLKELNLILKKV